MEQPRDEREKRDHDDEVIAHVEESIRKAEADSTKTQEEGIFDEDAEARARATEGEAPEESFFADSDAAHDPEGVEDDAIAP